MYSNSITQDQFNVVQNMVSVELSVSDQSKVFYTSQFLGTYTGGSSQPETISRNMKPRFREYFNSDLKL